jgi:PilZ domain-containing protein
MDSPQRHERRDFRYPLRLPVLIRIAQRKEMRARSENISLGGILLSSAFLIPEGSAVEVSVGVEHLPDPGILLNARGKVLRVQPKEAGDFAVAILLEEAFRLPPGGRSSDGTRPSVPKAKIWAPVTIRGMNLVPAWHTET